MTDPRPPARALRRLAFAALVPGLALAVPPAAARASLPDPSPVPGAPSASRPAPAAAPSPGAVPAASGRPAEAPLADWTRNPFSDLSSHGVLRRRPGLLAWSLDSARAFGSLAAAPDGAKRLFDFSLNLSVQDTPRSPERALFTGEPVRFLDGPLWSVAEARQDGLSAQAVTLFADQDAALAVLALRNAGRLPLWLRADLSVRRPGLGLAGTVERSRRYPAVWLELDRSQAAGRDLVDAAGVWLGGPAWGAAVSATALAPGRTLPLGGQGLDADLAWARPLLLRPGQSLRLPVLVVWGADLGPTQAQAERDWRFQALPSGRAYDAARRRWATLLSPLPNLGPRERLLRRCLLSLWHSRYGRRAALEADQFSADKGTRDAFFSVDTPLAALGWSEWDWDGAEAAVLDLADTGGPAPAAVPPYTGDEKLAWDAAGLPLDGLAAWELYHRDPDAGRAERFLAAYAPRLLRECAWWPSNRGGAGDGLYTFALDEELPDAAGQDPGFSGYAPAHAPSLRTWSLELSSLVAWQMQLGSVLAQAEGSSITAGALWNSAKQSQAALGQQGWDAQNGREAQGLDGFWPLYLGLESDFGKIQKEIEGYLIPAWQGEHEAAWTQDGAWVLWKTYFIARTLAQYGYLKQSGEIADDFVRKIDSLDHFPQKITAQGSIGEDNAATAAVCLEFLLKREQQDAFLTPDTGSFTQRWMQFRSLDGNFYMKRVKIPKKIEAYAPITIETPHKGKILEENAFVFSVPESMAFQIQSAQGLDISRAKTPQRLIFKDAHKIELLVPAHQRFLVRFVVKNR